MFSSPLPEIQQIAGMMKNAARDENAAPTLLKYTEPSSYIIESAKKLKALMVYLMGGIPVTLSDVVEMITFQSVEEELVATLLYEHGSHPMHDILNQIRLVASKDKAQYQLLIKTVIDTAVADRSKFDELLRAWRVGAGFVFDIAMDIGGFRDLHRHRRCIQVAQGYFAGMGADELQCPVKMLSKGGCDEVSVAKWNVLKERFSEDLEYLQGEFDTLQNLLENRHAPKQMAAYITELRTGPAGHASYRRVTWKMYELLRERHPEISAHIRATDFAEPVDLLKR
jgi:hypothetical protein